MPEFDIDIAMQTYLGGDPNTAAIQIGKRDERLFERFGDLAATIKPELDGILDDAVRCTGRRDNGDGPSITDWLRDNLPHFQPLTLRKIESHILYIITH
ncbi:hypothetical protein [Novipirellula sp.]|uniref:hypothetical protein n=1 Tax=Novipirellula sp. TaxID=2795430 RepID=UPI0035647AA9